MNKKILCLLLVCYSSLLSASTLSSTISATVEIYDGILVVNEQDLNFGQIYPGETADVLSSVSCQTMYDNPMVGRLHMVGLSNGDSLSLTTNMPTTLLHTDGLTTIPITVEDWWCQGTANTSERINSSKNVLGRADTPTTNLINFTGSVTASPTQLPGVYTANIDFSVTY